jgi:hypothetical protein
LSTKPAHNFLNSSDGRPAPGLFPPFPSGFPFLSIADLPVIPRHLQIELVLILGDGTDGFGIGFVGLIGGDVEEKEDREEEEGVHLSEIFLLWFLRQFRAFCKTSALSLGHGFAWE